jgi:hypothetical protein
MKLPSLAALRLTFDLAKLSEALRLSSDVVQAAFRDGRGAWPFSEKWGERLFEFATHANTNMPVSDGVHQLQRLGDLSVSVKALTRAGVKFQQSKDVGSGRKSDRAKLIASLEGCDRVVVVDITSFPEVVFYPIDTRRLLSAAHSGRLGIGGWSPIQFKAWISETYHLGVVEIGIDASRK